MFAKSKKTIAILSAAALLSIGANAVLAQEHSHSAHAHQAMETPQLSLNNGNKWETDANLRQAMTIIRDALSAELHGIHTGKTTAEQYKALAQKTNDQIAFMVKNCKLDPKADEMLHRVLTEIIAGADAMSGKDTGEARKGAEKIAAALDNYGKYFVHPGWDVASHAH